MTIGSSSPLPQIRYDHLHELSGRYGVFEHARFRFPRRNHGYTTDDNSRVLVVLADAQQPEEQRLLKRALTYVLEARGTAGWRNRRSDSGFWHDACGPDDAQARALWGLGHHAGKDDRIDAAISQLFALETVHPRANAYATLGAVAALAAHPEAEKAVDRFSAALPRPLRGGWRWPAARLTYANARIPQALIEAGVALEDCDRVDQGLELLEWLIGIEHGEGCFSFTPVAGRGPGDRGPAFDQQPIEAWAMVDACAAATRADTGSLWTEALIDAGLWFLGKNDIGVPLYEEATGAGFDGLTENGVNWNRGAESTLAALSSLSTLRQVMGMSPVS